MSPRQDSDDDDKADDRAYVSRIETSDQPMDIAFHPHRDNLLAAALVDGTLEVHDFRKDDDDDDDDSDDEFDSLLSSLALHSSSNYTRKSPSKKKPTASCKCVAFSHDGSKIYTGGSPYGDLCAVDAERACTFSPNAKVDPLWRIDSATASPDDRDNNSSNNDDSEYNNLHRNKNNPLVTLYPFLKDGQTPLLATGDDHGGIRIWDERLCGGGGGSNKNNNKRPKGCVMEWNLQEDYISDIHYSPHNNGKNQDGSNILLAASADGSLGVYDLRMNKGDVADTTRKSDHLDDELLSLCVLKHGKKVICGTQTGALSIFSWGTWGDISDRFPGHPHSVETLLKVDENTVLTGSSDGLIRVVQVHPDKFLGVLNENEHDDAFGHGGNPIEKLAFNANKDIVGSLTHDNFVRLWDARILKDDGDDDDDDDEDNDDYSDDDEDRKPAAAVGSQGIRNPAATKKNDDGDNNSDDDWEDMDDEEKKDNNDDDDDDSDDDDSDDSEPAPETVNDRRKKRMKTENEKFFDDL